MKLIIVFVLFFFVFRSNAQISNHNPTSSTFHQQQIVNRIEQEQRLINANKQLIQIFEQKIKDEINKLWQTDTKEYAIEDEPLSLVAEE